MIVVLVIIKHSYFHICVFNFDNVWYVLGYTNMYINTLIVVWRKEKKNCMSLYVYTHVNGIIPCLIANVALYTVTTIIIFWYTTKMSSILSIFRFTVCRFFFTSSISKWTKVDGFICKSFTYIAKSVYIQNFSHEKKPHK